MRRVVGGVVSIVALLLAGCTQQHLAPVTSVNTLDEPPASSSAPLPAGHDATVLEEMAPPPPEHLRKPQTAAATTSQQVKLQPQAKPTPQPAKLVSDDMPVVPVPAQYTVQPGDTLGAIAHHYGLSYIYLAKLNQIDPPYVIHIGQVLKLKGELPATAPSATKAEPSNAASQPATEPTQSVVKPLLKPTPQVSQTRTIDDVTWSWPAQGKVQNQFNPQGDVFHQGVDIISQGDAQVDAAAQGTVLFSGQGAKGYGQMIILQHSNDYLSAYSELAKILVKEGEQVQRGQQIAKMGAVDGQTQMHFEVRHHGQPVDPLNYLPKE